MVMGKRDPVTLEYNGHVAGWINAYRILLSTNTLMVMSAMIELHALHQNYCKLIEGILRFTNTISEDLLRQIFSAI